MKKKRFFVAILKVTDENSRIRSRSSVLYRILWGSWGHVGFYGIRSESSILPMRIRIQIQIQIWLHELFKFLQVFLSLFLAVSLVHNNIFFLGLHIFYTYKLSSRDTVFIWNELAFCGSVDAKTS
jgi:hypothetical protein